MEDYLYNLDRCPECHSMWVAKKSIRFGWNTYQCDNCGLNWQGPAEDLLDPPFLEREE